ncbi:RtcB family protein [Niabella drilacis]|uniref:3'-phosphate/5'-hydroxy nucleic acid ligase n=1 Tax=Niabella drilacis (strain DSM 25811 / CCM 8410 / CCUG 62505 / LMG 26954 / E90) TaxID=1285928 RepID=A0A1G6T7S6_NIADE|nr:RtcB family protein [Niabella drilacis]SDD24415.1 tRNA-splicing ligase RtcB [Niabella drilacis]
MNKLKITGKELRQLGYPEGPVISITMNLMQKHYKYESKENALAILRTVLQAPSDFVSDAVLAPVAQQLLPPPPKETAGMAVSLNQTGIGFNVFGSAYIEEGAMAQMYTAAKLPVSVAGALMPDAHQGYGLPIGGVLATKNAVIPYGVGVDIGCRMCLSIFDIDPKELTNREHYFVREINEATLFGSGAQFQKAENHAVMDHEAFQHLPFLKELHGRAWKQLGSSGSGNHFVEFGIVEIPAHDEVLQVPPGLYLGLLSHSGSRALGAAIATHYTKIAISKRRLPQDAKNLAWLNLDEEEGQEYWLAMNLAGDYASACHHIIHAKIARQLGRKPVKMVENHHNFAWKELLEGQELVVHRKGATPAGRDVLGIIPGSMTAAGFIVKGKGSAAAVNSASHGAGRKMSRSRALQSITDADLKKELSKHGVKLISAGLDEAPFAYKDIEVVMKSQQTLVDVIGKFTPKIVKMAGDKIKKWQEKE